MGFLRMLPRCIFAMLLAGSAGVSSAAPLLSERKDFFPIGVWQQPTNSFAKWKSRGINTLMEVPEGHDLRAWSNAAVSAGLYMLREPDNGSNTKHADSVAAARRADLAAYRSHLLAWTQPDEADFNEYSITKLRAEYEALKAIDAKNPPKVLMNFSGATVLGAPARDGSSIPEGRYRRYSGSADWISNDIYPITGWGRSDWIDYAAPLKQRKTPGRAVNKLRTLSDNKPQLAVIETSDQNLSWVPGDHGVDRDEFRGQLWHSIIHGAQGIVYFPFQFNDRFTFDATPADVVEEMIIQHARIQRLASVINAPRDPRKLGFAAGTKKAAILLEATWRRGRGADYFFVLNMSSRAVELPFDLVGVEGTGVIHGEKRSLRPNGKGLYRDRFAPWEIHVYKFAHPLEGAVKKRARTISVVPEPGALGLCTGLVGFLLRRPSMRGRARLTA